MEAILIRQATYDDFDAVYHFVNELSNGGEPMDGQIQHAIFNENAGNPNNVYLMAFIRTIPVGFVSCHVQNLLHHGGKVGEIQEMFVVENARNLGVGRKLIEHLKDAVADRNLTRLEVASGLKREAAHRFYEREDFKWTHKKFVLKF